MNLKTNLISGAGNTFHVTQVFCDNAGNPPFTTEKMKMLTVRVCSENPADGFIFLAKASPVGDEFKWWFFNNDGSDAEMCGNATRCVGYFIENQLGSTHKSWRLKTVAGNITIDYVDKKEFKIKMTPIKKYSSDFGFYCDTGVPHLVIETKKLITNQKLKQEARLLRNHPSFLPRGTNVTFIEIESDEHKVKAVSYERGVEDFTAACGTGAMAAAFYNLTKRGVKQTQVEMPGGTLMMDLSDLGCPEMTGPAVLLGSFEYDISI